MKIATWNVNGIRARASQFHDWIEAERPDVVCLQELKAELSQVPEAVRRTALRLSSHPKLQMSDFSLRSK